VAGIGRSLTAALCIGLLGACTGGGTAGVPNGGNLAADAPAATAADDCSIPAKLVGVDLERLPVQKKLMALTFDAGANADGVPSIRKTLNSKGVRASFFLTGRFVQSFPKKSRLIAAEQLVGNHTNTHPDLTTLSDDQVRAEVTDAAQLIRDTTGEDPRRFFRFPFGTRNAHTIGLLNDLCYVPFRWTVDTLGWQGTSGGMTQKKVVARVLAAAAPGAIVLMHVGSNPDDGTTLDADALPTIVDRLRDRGFSLVRLSRVMSAAP
jgi:peptidoglycan/xylan/chitin deacetylase (PgdA/CDA1 family)